MKKLSFILLFFMMFFISCASDTPKQVKNTEVNDNSNKSVSENTIEDDKLKETNENLNDNSKSANNSTKSTVNNTNEAKDTQKLMEDNSNKNIKEEVINYIINGQENKSEAEKLKWSETFLNKVDIESLYKKYVSEGGKSDDIEGVSKYITSNAPILKDWKNLFEEDLYNIYGEKVVRLEKLDEDLYQAYVEIDGKEVQYVVVSSRTGYFHG